MDFLIDEHILHFGVDAIGLDAVGLDVIGQDTVGPVGPDPKSLDTVGPEDVDTLIVNRRTKVTKKN